MKFAAQRRFTPEQEAEIVRLYATGQHSQHALARMNGCSQGTIARILKDKPDMNVAALQRRIAKLEAALANAQQEGMEKVERHFRVAAALTPIGDENLVRGASTYNWLMHCATTIAAIRAAAKVAGGKDE